MTVTDRLNELGTVWPGPREETSDFVLYLTDTVMPVPPWGCLLAVCVYLQTIPQITIAMRVRFFDRKSVCM